MLSTETLTYTGITDLATPTDGYVVHLDRWWVVDPDKGAAFHHPNRDGGIPQCNANRGFIERLAESYGLTAVFVPVAFVPPAQVWVYQQDIASLERPLG